MLEHDKKTDIFLAHMGVCMHTEDTLEHKEKPKYIAKIGEGAKARYFYTVEAFNAYKKALSSKDEAAEVKKAQNHPDIEYDEYDLGDGRKITSWTTTNNEAAAALEKADAAYYESKTLRGKAKAVNETRKELKADRQERREERKEAKKNEPEKTTETKTEPTKTTETKTEPKPKKEIGSGIKEYAKAVSSSDEKQKEADAKAKADKANADYQKKLDAFNEVDGTLQFKKRKEALAELEKAAAKANKANAEYSKAQQAHLDSRTSNKVKAVAEVFDKRNPEVSKRIKKGRDWVKSRLG